MPLLSPIQDHIVDALIKIMRILVALVGSGLILEYVIAKLGACWYEFETF